MICQKNLLKFFSPLNIVHFLPLSSEHFFFFERPVYILQSEANTNFHLLPKRPWKNIHFMLYLKQFFWYFVISLLTETFTIKNTHSDTHILLEISLKKMMTALYSNALFPVFLFVKNILFRVDWYIKICLKVKQL